MKPLPRHFADKRWNIAQILLDSLLESSIALAESFNSFGENSSDRIVLLMKSFVNN